MEIEVSPCANWRKQIVFERQVGNLSINRTTLKVSSRKNKLPDEITYAKRQHERRVDPGRLKFLSRKDFFFKRILEKRRHLSRCCVNLKRFY